MNENFPETADIETASEAYARRFAGPVGAYFLAEQTRITGKLLAGMTNCSILDVGGGHCQLAPALVEWGHRVTITGSDDVCRSRPEQMLPAGSFRYRTCDSLQLPFADNEFDVVLSFRLLPHVEQWQRLVAELCRVANQLVIVDYPDIRSCNIFYRLLFRLKKSFEGNTRTYTMFTRAQIRQAFVANGFARPLWLTILHPHCFARNSSGRWLFIGPWGIRVFHAPWSGRRPDWV